MMHGTSTSSLMSDDVTVRCRVIRRSASSSSPATIQDEPLEMTCTMRHWDKASPRFLSRRSLASVSPHDGSSQNHTGPELLLTPLQDLLPPTCVRSRSNNQLLSGNSVNTSSNNNQQHPSSTASPLRRRGSYRSHSNMRRSMAMAPVSVILLPLADLILSNVHPSKREFHWTTGSHGSWTIQGLDQNAFDILLAFLQARMPPERIVYQMEDESAAVKEKTTKRSLSSGSNHPSIPNSTSSVASSCFDVDALTAAHVKGRVNQETLGEKVSRRVSHVLAAISDWGNGLGLATLMEDIDTKCCSGNTVCCNNNNNNNNNNHGGSGTGDATADLNQSPYHRQQISDDADRKHHDQRIRDGRTEVPKYQSSSGNHRDAATRQQSQSPQRLTSSPEHQVLKPFRYSDLEMDDNDSNLSAGRAGSVLPLTASISQASSILEGEASFAVADTQRL